MSTQKKTVCPIFAFLAVVIFLIAETPAYAQEIALKEDAGTTAIIATVGSWSMTLGEFEKYLELIQQGLPPETTITIADKKTVLEQLVEQQLLVQEAKKQGLDKDKDIVFAMKEFEKTLLAQRVAVEALKDVTVPDEDAKTFYDENQEMILSPTQWRIAEIVVGSETEAKKLVVELNQGAEFADIAKAHSQHESAAKGGDMGFVDDFAFDKLAQKAIFLDVGEMSGAFQGPDGFYIIKLLGKKGGEVRTFEDAKEDIKKELLGQVQQQAYIDYLANLQKDVKVETKPELLEEKK